MPVSLSPLARAAAKPQLTAMQMAARSQLETALLGAYGVITADEKVVDRSHSLADHFPSLKAGLTIAASMTMRPDVMFLPIFLLGALWLADRRWPSTRGLVAAAASLVLIVGLVRRHAAGSIILAEGAPGAACTSSPNEARRPLSG